MSVGRISEVKTTVVLPCTVDVSIGHYNACSAETPDPPRDVLVSFARDRRADTLWPFEYWHPDGWMVINGSTSGAHLCPACASKVYSTVPIKFVEKRR